MTLTLTKQAPRARLALFSAALAAASVALAQNAAPNATPGETPVSEQTVQMSAFEVRTTQGQGYTAGNAASALKSSQPIMDLSADVLVVTSDLIKDIGQNNASDTLQWAGVGSYYRGPAIMIRGSRIANAYWDDVPLSLPSGISDNADVDTYEVIKGPMQVLYPGASLAGIVLQTSKKPLPGLNQYIISGQVNQYGGNRETFDVNSPVGQLGDGQLTFRVVGVYQSPHQVFINVPEEHLCIWPDLEWDWKQTKVIAQYDAQIMYYLPGGTSILTPQGGLYTGDGRRIEGAPPNDEDKNEQHDAHLTWIQKISGSWENKVQAVYENFRRYGLAAYPGTVNWQTNTVTYVVRLDDEFSDAFSFQDDAIGKYNIGPIPNTSQFGYNHLDTNNAPDYFPTYNVAIPIGSPAAINSIVIPSSRSTFPANPATPSSRQENYTDQGYFMQTIDVVPNWLTLVGGLTFSKIEQINDTNVAVANPYTATDLNGHALLHAFGFLLHLTKDVSLYGRESTTFTTSPGVNYLNLALPQVLGKDDEIGIKTSFLDGKISSTFDVYRMSLTNQAILAQFPALNIAGTNYYIPIGTTHYSGWEGNLELAPFPGFQLIAAGFVGTIEDQNGNPVTQTYGNQWSVFANYDFTSSSPLRGLRLGGGVVRQGAKYFSMASLTPPGGTPPAGSPGGFYTDVPSFSNVALFKLHEGTLVNLFVSYEVNRHLDLEVTCENVLNVAYPEGAQGVGLVDPSDPQLFTLQATYKF